jgi:hypothetical protein
MNGPRDRQFRAVSCCCLTSLRRQTHCLLGSLVESDMVWGIPNGAGELAEQNAEAGIRHIDRLVVVLVQWDGVHRNVVELSVDEDTLRAEEDTTDGVPEVGAHDLGVHEVGAHEMEAREVEAHNVRLAGYVAVGTKHRLEDIPEVVVALALFFEVRVGQKPHGHLEAVGDDHQLVHTPRDDLQWVGMAVWVDGHCHSDDQTADDRWKVDREESGVDGDHLWVDMKDSSLVEAAKDRDCADQVVGGMTGHDEREHVEVGVNNWEVGGCLVDQAPFEKIGSVEVHQREVNLTGFDWDCLLNLARCRLAVHLGR